ncbi:prolyl-tRNA synthetase associated domain-containing protein [Pseudoalteromonas sp. XMcav1-K]|uniref:prolyl-tRNA synthetase associated domain-containing protein n=1 Tax=Pseudoalteromonas sp. XMcav1-K TaxID=3374372 RepID=UPI003756EB6E
MTDIAFLEKVFSELAIDCEKISHPPLHTAVEADRLLLERPGTRLKNLFLRDNYGKRHFLLITSPNKQVDLKALSKSQGLSRLGFASNERLAKYLAVNPGCVSMLALLNDAENAVQLWVDDAIWQSDLFHCHPFDNTQTWLMQKNDLLKVFEYSNHSVELVSL